MEPDPVLMNAAKFARTHRWGHGALYAKIGRSKPQYCALGVIGAANGVDVQSGETPYDSIERQFGPSLRRLLRHLGRNPESLSTGVYAWNDSSYGGLAAERHPRAALIRALEAAATCALEGEQ